jgi:hypothetical protein
MPEPGAIAIAALWLIFGVYGFLDGRTKAKSGKKDVTSSPIFIVAWPIMMGILSPVVVGLFFIPVFGVAWLIDFVGARFGLNYLGDGLVVAALITIAFVARIKARNRIQKQQS